MNRDAYSTPKEVFAVFNEEFNFAIDVAASCENALCATYFSEERSALTRDWFPDGSISWAGQYAWCNPPYSDIGPWVAKAAEQSGKGIGTVMLVMMDQSVGWYREAIKTCQEVRLVIGGRLSFIDPSTGKPAAGNNKGSMFIIWHPFGRTPVRYSHIERDEMLAAGRELLEQATSELVSNPCQLPEPELSTDALQLPCLSENAESETQPVLSGESEPETEPVGPDNPFFSGFHHEKAFYIVDAKDRIARVKQFTLEQCQAALKVSSLQSTVATAIEVRIRKLSKQEQAA